MAYDQACSAVPGVGSGRILEGCGMMMLRWSVRVFIVRRKLVELRESGETVDISHVRRALYRLARYSPDDALMVDHPSRCMIFQ